MGKRKSSAHKLARKFWDLRPEKKDAVCDKCNSTIRRGQGYLCKPAITGFGIGIGDSADVLADVSRSPDLVCEHCFDASPSALPFRRPWEFWRRIPSQADIDAAWIRAFGYPPLTEEELEKQHKAEREERARAEDKRIDDLLHGVSDPARSRLGFCPACQSELYERARQCLVCSHSWHKCPKCAAEWQRGSDTCNQCHHNLYEIAPEERERALAKVVSRRTKATAEQSHSAPAR